MVFTDDPGGSRLSVTLDASGLSEGVRAASEDIEAVVREDVLGSLSLVDEAVQETGKTLSRELSKAAKTGELSFRNMANAILKDLADLAINQFVRGPVEGAVSSIFKALPFGGARAAGGGVTPGAAFLVGERGPELFSPSAPGRVSPIAAGANVTVNMNFPAGTDVESFRRSETQIAAMVSRATARGSRIL